MNESPAEYGVIGHPVGHSRSPFIHALFAKQTGQQLVYRLHDVAPENLHTYVMDFWRRGGKGLNVTVPHKVAACGLVRAMSERATRAGAVNTLLMDEDGITGDNTDGAGLVRDLTVNLKVDLGDARILLLGAGGAARGVVGPLLDQSPQLIMIAGRSAERAESLARPFRRAGPGAGLRPRAPRAQQLRPHHQCHLRRTRRRTAGDPEGRAARGDVLLRHVVRARRDRVPGVGEATGLHARRRRAGGCWWSRPPNRSSCGAACARSPRRYWPPWRPGA